VTNIGRTGYQPMKDVKEGEDNKPLEFKEAYGQIEGELRNIFKKIFLLGEMQGLAKAGNQFVKVIDKIKLGGELLNGIKTDTNTIRKD
jgi:hypothetical protein